MVILLLHEEEDKRTLTHTQQANDIQGDVERGRERPENLHLKRLFRRKGK
jgi:hypothetical protein